MPNRLAASAEPANEGAVFRQMSMKASTALEVTGVDESFDGLGGDRCRCGWHCSGAAGEHEQAGQGQCAEQRIGHDAGILPFEIRSAAVGLNAAGTGDVRMVNQKRDTQAGQHCSPSKLLSSRVHRKTGACLITPYITASGLARG